MQLFTTRGSKISANAPVTTTVLLLQPLNKTAVRFVFTVLCSLSNSAFLFIFLNRKYKKVKPVLNKQMTDIQKWLVIQSDTTCRAPGCISSKRSVLIRSLTNYITRISTYISKWPFVSNKDIFSFLLCSETTLFIIIMLKQPILKNKNQRKVM